MMVSYFIMEANNNNLSIHTGETGASSMYSISFFQISCCNGIDSFRIESILAQAWLSNSRSPGWSMNIIRCQSYSAAMYCISSFCWAIAQAVKRFSSCCSGTSLTTSHVFTSLSCPLISMYSPGAIHTSSHVPGKPRLSDIISIFRVVETVSRKENCPFISVSLHTQLRILPSSSYRPITMLSGRLANSP